MEKEDSEFEIIDMEKEAESPASIPEGRSYEEVINDTTPSKTYCINGIYFYIINESISSDVKGFIVNHGGCRECIKRTKKFSNLIGENGPSFLCNIRCFGDGCVNGSLFKAREKIMSNYEISKKIGSTKMIFIVEENSFPPIQDGVDELGVPYEHITIFPDNYTSQENVDKYKKLLTEQLRVIQPRLEKLCDPEAIKSVQLINDNIYKLERSDHWRSVLNWVMNIQKKTNGKKYSNMTNEEKVLLSVYALTTGRIESDEITVVHKDYKQASNIVDFLTLGPIEKVLKEMDIRSDPNNYMISQLARNMTKHKVTSKYTISLVWDGKYKDDLDLDVIWNYDNKTERVFYQNKIQIINNETTRLDFDANVTHGESEPAENISCSPYGSYTIRVNNFTRRTKHEDIPFTVIIHQEGKSDIMIERVWPVDRQCGTFMIIKENFKFTEVDNPELEMSTKAAARAKVVNDEWIENFGLRPISIVPDIINLINVPIHYWEKGIREINIMDVSSGFMDMAIETTKKKKDGKEKKKYLSEIEGEKFPDTLSKLLLYMSKGKHDLKIDPRNFSPGYITEIKTPKEVMNTKYSLNHFENKYVIPTRPSKTGNARFDENWFTSNVLFRHVDVHSIIQFGKNWFMVINNTKLPNHPDFPLCGGFHPGKLKPTFHSNHNYQWTYCNTQILPQVSNNEGIPLIGSFLVSEKATFILNGKEITVTIK